MVTVTELNGESVRFLSLNTWSQDDRRTISLSFSRIDERVLGLFFDIRNGEITTLSNLIMQSRYADGPTWLFKRHNLYKISASNFSSENNIVEVEYAEVEKAEFDFIGDSVILKVYFNIFHDEVTNCIMEQFERED